MISQQAHVRRKRGRSQRLANVKVDASGLLIDGQLEVPSHTVDWVRVERRRVRVVALGDELVIAARDTGAAEALRRELLLHARPRAERFRFAPQWLVRRPWGNLGWVLAVGGFLAWMLVVPTMANTVLPAAAAVALAFAPLLCVAGLLLLGRMDVTVGDDGVLLAPALAKSRFVRTAEIVDVHARADMVDLRLRDGEVVRVFGFAPAEGGVDTEIAALASSVQAARQRASLRNAKVAPAALSPVGSGAAWLTRAERLLDGEAGYRAATMSSEDVRQVLSDPGQPRRLRVAAAALLKAKQGAGARARIDAAAEAAAEPELREELEAIARAESDAEVLAVLARVE